MPELGNVSRVAESRDVEGGLKSGWSVAGHADHVIDPKSGSTPVEGGIAEGEDATVGCGEPVAVPVRSGSHADDLTVEMECPGRPIELGVAEREDPAV
jgi:hypothetical protein